MNWKVLTGVLLVLYVTVTSSKEVRSTASTISHGLSTANELGKLIEGKQFTNVIGKIASNVAPYLGVVGSFVSFVMGFAGHSESAELKAIKHLHTEIDNRFDKVNSQFAEVKNLIDWKTIEIQFSTIELKINAVNKHFENIYKFSTGGTKDAATGFIENYEHNYGDSGSLLYAGIMHKGRLFGNSILTAITKYTHNHRAKCQAFMMGLLQLLMKAAKVELAYYQLKGRTGALHDYQNSWIGHLTHYGSEMHTIDKNIFDHYHTQVGIDIDNELVKHLKTSMNNNDFNNHMYAFLAEKYPWRHWLTVTYNDITGGNVHYVGQCDGFIKFRNHGRNVVVASVDHNKKHIDLAQAKSIAYNVDNCHPKSTNGYTVYHRTDSDKAYNTFPASVKDHCSPYAAQGVIYHSKHNGNDVHFKAAPNRMYVRNRENCNFVFLFG